MLRVNPIAKAQNPRNNYDSTTVDQLRTQRRANSPTEAAGDRDAEEAPRSPDVDLDGVDAQLVQRDGSVIQHVGRPVDAAVAGTPGLALFVERHRYKRR